MGVNLPRGLKVTKIDGTADIDVKETARKKPKPETPFEQQLFKAADKLRKNIDAAEYKHVVLGLIFLKYISDSFQVVYDELMTPEMQEEFDHPEEDRDQYTLKNTFWVPPQARYSHIFAESKKPEIGKTLDDAMDLIEAENPTLKGILPKVYARQNLDKAALGGLIDLIGNIAVGTEAAKSKDILGRVYEYFLGEFAAAEGKKGGQFYTPRSIVKLMTEMVEPYKGRIYDPCCGSGGMFIMSEKFVESHQGKVQDISIYGQESNHTTHRLCRMNLAIRGIDGSQIKWNNEGSFLNDELPDLRADFILANPPFNQKEWGAEVLTDDPRFTLGMPPKNSANYAWMQHMIYHLAPKGTLALVLANGSLSSNSGGEGDIRRKLVEAGMVDCIVALPKQLFYNTGIPACLWFISKSSPRPKETLFIDASELGFMIDRTHRDFADDDLKKISDTYHAWKKEDESYEDEKGFCKSAELQEIEKHGFVLTPGRYVGIPDEEDDGVPFEEKIGALANELSEQMKKEAELNQEIKKQLAKIGVVIE